MSACLFFGQFAHAQNSQIEFERSEYRVAEGSPIKAFLRRSGGTSGQVTVSFSIRAITATAGSDFVRGNSRDPSDFRANYNWDDGQFGNTLTGLSQDVEILTLADDVSGEGDETILIEITGISGGTIGPNSSTTIIIEDDTTVRSCTTSNITSLVVWDFNDHSFFEVPEFDGSFERLLGLGRPLGFNRGLMAVANSCTDYIRFRMEGEAGMSRVDPIFSQEGSHFFPLRGGEEELLMLDFASGGGLDCSDPDQVCHLRSLEVTPYGGGGVVGDVFSSRIELSTDESNDVVCAIEATTKEQFVQNLLNGVSDSGGLDNCPSGYVPLPENSSICINTETNDYRTLRAQLGVPYKARNLGTPNRITVEFGETRTLDLMELVPQTSSAPNKNRMGIAIYREHRNGDLSTSPGGRNMIGGQWYQTDSTGQLYYTGDSLGDDRFSYIIIPPDSGTGYDNDNQQDGFNHCRNSKGEVFLEVVQSQPTNEPPRITSIDPSGTLQVMENQTATITVNASDDKGGLSYEAMRGSSIISITGSGPVFTINGDSAGTTSIDFTVIDSDGVRSPNRQVSVSVSATDNGTTGGTTGGAECIDSPPVGDGWGWNGTSSCRIGNTTGGTMTGGSTTGTGTTGGTTGGATCIDSPPVGDGWGWDGTSSCRIGTTSGGTTTGGSTTGGGTTGGTTGGDPACIDSPPVGDGWGWNGTSSCRVGATSGSTTGGGSTGGTTSGDSACVDSPPVGDGWGWNGTSSCRVGSITGGGTTGGTSEPAQCVDSPPVGDGWGWNGSSSCRI